MNEIKSTYLSSLTVGDVFSIGPNGPYVVTQRPRTGDGLTVIQYRSVVDGRPSGRPMEFYRASLSTVLVSGRIYGPELYEYV